MEGDKGGPRANTLTNPDLPRAGTRVFKGGGGHVTAVFGSSSVEAMPPIMIYETKSKTAKKMRVKPSWVQELPEVVGQWGFQTETVVNTQIAVRTKGSMDETLFIKTFLFYKSLFPNLAPRFKWDGDRLIKGPIFIKADCSHGKNCKSEAALKFCHDMHCEGIHLGPGLPNATSCNQEMDDWFQDLKGRTDAQAQEIFKQKVYEYALAVKDCQNDRDTEIESAALTNDDLPQIIKGLRGNPIEKRPFSCCVTKEEIFKSWMAVGFVPFTQNALSHKKVQHLLGDGGASDEMTDKLSSTLQKYKELKEKVNAFLHVFILSTTAKNFFVLEYNHRLIPSASTASYSMRNSQCTRRVHSSRRLKMTR